MLGFVPTVDVAAQANYLSETSVPKLRLGKVAAADPVRGQAALEVRVPVYLSTARDSNYIALAIFFEDSHLVYKNVEARSESWKLSRVNGFREHSSGFVRGVFLRGGDVETKEDAVRQEEGAKEAPGGDEDTIEEELIAEVVFQLATRDSQGAAHSYYFTPVSLKPLASNPPPEFVGERSATGILRGGEKGGSVDFYATGLEAGGVTIYYHDFAEVGGGEMTRRRQSFIVPVYVTLTAGADLIAVGVDYDELILLDVEAVTPPVLPGHISIHPGGLHTSVFALEVDTGFAGSPLFQTHVADLVFRYDGEESDEGGAISIDAHLLRLGGGGDNGEGQGGAYRGSLPGVIEFVKARFVRGNVDSNIAANSTEQPRYEPDMNDAVMIVKHISGTSLGRLPCQEAADVDDDGFVSITDAVLLLRFLYMNGSPPVTPFPAPGDDRSESATHLGCDYSLPYFEPADS